MSPGIARCPPGTQPEPPVDEVLLKSRSQPGFVVTQPPGVGLACFGGRLTVCPCTLAEASCVAVCVWALSMAGSLAWPSGSLAGKSWLSCSLLGDLHPVPLYFPETRFLIFAMGLRQPFLGGLVWMGHAGVWCSLTPVLGSLQAPADSVLISS